MGRLISTVVLFCLLLLATKSRCRKYTDGDLREILFEILELEREGHIKITGDNRLSVAQWLRTKDPEIIAWDRKSSLAEWNYETNITDATRQQMAEIKTQYSTWFNGIREEAKKFVPDVNDRNLDPDTARKFRLLLKTADSSNSEDVRKIKDLSGQMAGIYSTAQVCGREQCLSMEPGLQRVMADSRDPLELSRAWVGWRNSTGPTIKPLYLEFVKLLNKGARENGYSDYSEYWRDEQFDNTPDLEKICDRLWSEVEPLYLQLHAYVRRKLTEKYGKDVIGTNGTIPAHLLGNMWAQNWRMISDIVSPLSDSKHDNEELTADSNLKASFDVKKLFETAEDFYKSIGMFPMTQIFWEKSMLVKPDNRNVTCHPSASDLFGPKDFRIKMCTEVNLDYFTTIHHEMGHIEYFMAYSQQPALYRSGANSAFHEAIGDTMALSVMTRKHLHTLGLLEDAQADAEGEISDLLNMALVKLAFLPYGYLLDKWRWRVFSGEIDEDHLNEEYWNMRLKYQGLVSPVPRSERDFDPAAKYHVPVNSAYMCYFISFIIQFQFYETLCDASGHQGALHTCDFFNSKAAGTKLKSVLELGSSLPWPDAMEKLTGSREISVGPLKEYFQPLLDWLRIQNQNDTVGWAEASINWK